MNITGIGSGLDINAIVKAMVDAERAPKVLQLDRLEKSTTTKFSALGQLRSALSEFQTVLKELNDPKLFERRTATSSKTDIFTATADSSAVSGNFSVQVFNLAQSSKVALRGVDDPSEALGTGTLTINVGDQQLDIEVAEGANNLTAIRDAINRDGKDMGLSAAIVNDPNGVGGARLVLTSTRQGEGNDISVTSSSTSGDLGVLDFTPPPPGADYAPTPVDPDDLRAPRVISYARDANLAIDGINLTSSSNTIENAIEGVSLTLKAAQSAEDIASANTVALAVSEDRAGVKSSLKNFVDAYNKMMGVMNSLTKVTPVGDSEPVVAALVGDASVRSITSAIRGELSSVQGDGAVRILADMGITTQKDGTLKLDDAQLDKVLQDSFGGVSAMLTGETGLMTRLNARIDPYTQTGGILEGRTKALEGTLKNVDEQREALSRRVTQMEARLFAQFNAMDMLVGQLSQTSQYLENQLSNLPGVVRQDRKR